MTTKDDQKHLKCLKEEEKFLISLQIRLQKQLKLLKVEKAALLKMISMAARSGSGLTDADDTSNTVPFSTTATNDNDKKQTTLSSHETLYSSQGGCNEDLFGDTVVNQAPLDLEGLTVAKGKNQNLPMLDINPLYTEELNDQSKHMGMNLRISDEDDDDEDDDDHNDDDDDDDDDY